VDQSPETIFHFEEFENVPFWRAFHVLIWISGDDGSISFLFKSCDLVHVGVMRVEPEVVVTRASRKFRECKFLHFFRPTVLFQHISRSVRIGFGVVESTSPFPDTFVDFGRWS
jgi:hypothetical protein